MEKRINLPQAIIDYEDKKRNARLKWVQKFVDENLTDWQKFLNALSTVSWLSWLKINTDFVQIVNRIDGLAVQVTIKPFWGKSRVVIHTLTKQEWFEPTALEKSLDVILERYKYEVSSGCKLSFPIWLRNAYNNMANLDMGFTMEQAKQMGELRDGGVFSAGPEIDLKANPWLVSLIRSTSGIMLSDIDGNAFNPSEFTELQNLKSE